MPECPEHGLYHEYHGRCPHRHCGDDRPDSDHETCVPGSYDGDVLVSTDRGDVPVDPCISGIVSALNDGGVPTSASCCGHGKAHGGILLSDGRWLIVVADRAEALRLQSEHDPSQSQVAELSEFAISNEALDAMTAQNDGGDPLDPNQASELLKALKALRDRMRARAEKHEARSDELVAPGHESQNRRMLASVHASQAEELRFLLSGREQQGDW